MFRLEKVLQNDDSAFIIFVNFSKSIIILLSFYIFSILEKNTIYDLLNIEIFIQSKFFYFSLFLTLFYFTINLFNKNNSIYYRNFISFLKEDVLSLFISNFIIFSLFFILKKNFLIDKIYLLSLIFILFNLSLSKLFFNLIYDYLVKKNIIQKNIMLVGNYNDIKDLLKNKFDDIYVFKCCIILDIKKYNLNLIKSEIKFPIFTNDEDVRSILEYHALGQVWLLDRGINKIENSLLKILKYSVDILVIKLNKKYNLKGKKLLVNKYDFEFYEISRFHGVNLFVKVLLGGLFNIY